MTDRRRPRLRLAVVILCAALVAVACGTRRDMAELVAAASGPVGANASEEVVAPGGSTEDAAEAVGPAEESPDTGAGLGPAAGTAPESASSGTPSAPEETPPGEDGGEVAVGGAACSPNCSPLIIGSVGTYSGLVGQNVGPGVRALQAWAATINAKGGLNGHQVQVVVADDGGDPARHRSLLQELVEDRGVVAFVYNAAPLSGQASVDYIKKNQIPVIGSEAAGEWFYSSPFFFPQSTSGKLINVSSLAAAASSRPSGEDKLGLIYCSEGISICEIAREYADETAGGTGWDLVYTGSASLAQPDFTASCLAARDAGAQALVLAMDGNSALRIARSCNSIGYKPKLILNQQIEFQYLAEEPLMQGSYATGLNAPWYDSSNPGVAEFQRAMAQYAPGVELAGSPIQGWASAKLLEAAGPAISEPPTSESILDGLYALQGETLNGVAPPLTFTMGQISPRYACYWPIIIRDGEYRNSGDGSMGCVDVPPGIV